jgi:hypothetical protein
MRFDLPLYDSERIIFFNEISNDDIKIAQYYGYQYIGAEKNIGIAEGYKRLVAKATGEFFLFLENDWELIAYPNAALADSRYLISANEADIVKLRHRKTPGNPLWSTQFKNRELDSPKHLLDCAHWQDEPDKLFPDKIKRYDTYGRVWYTTTSRYANWSNNPHFARTQWLRDNILPQLGAGDIERHMQPWWEQQEFKVAQGDGLFTHNRLD